MTTPPPRVRFEIYWPRRNARLAWERHQEWLRLRPNMPNRDWQAGQKWFKAYKDAALRAIKVTRCPKAGSEFLIQFPTEEVKNG